MSHHKRAFRRVDASISKHNPLIVNIHVTTEVSGAVYVKYKNKHAGKFLSECIKKPSKEHKFTIGRLRASTKYKYRVYLVSGEKTYRSHRYSFTTGSLPENLASSLSLKLEGRFSKGAGVIVLCVAGAASPSDFFQGYVGIDRDGQIVWFYQSPKVPGPAGTPVAGDFFKMRDGNFLITRGYALGLPNPFAGIFQAPQMEIITPEGKLVGLQLLVCSNDPGKIGKKGAVIAEFGQSHASFQDPGDSLIYTIGMQLKDPYFDAGLAPPGTKMQLGGTIRSWNPVTEEQKVLKTDFELLNVFKYRSSLSDLAASTPVDCDGSEPGLNNQDWTHDNAISRLSCKSNFFLSQRDTSAVLILEPKTFRLLFKFGSTAPSDFKFVSPDDHFYGQHDAHEIHGGNLLMFDDGTGRPDAEGGQYGRGIEYKLDYKTKVISKVWEFRPAVDIECDNVGSCRRLGNGHTIVDFGASNLTIKHVFEAGKKSNVQVADLQVSSPLSGNSWILYRAIPIESIFGEVQIKNGKRHK